MTSPSYLIGVDTGGTCTDAAITQALAPLLQRLPAKYIRLVAMPAERVRQLSCTVIQLPGS